MEPPIFCDECPGLAMAMLDHSRLCADCLMAAVRGRDEACAASTSASRHHSPPFAKATVGRPFTIHHSQTASYALRITHYGF